MSFLKIPSSQERDIRREAKSVLKEIARWETALKDPLHLQHQEMSVFSQNGEDGMIAEALRRLQITNPTFVEFGASDGSENCTRGLLEIGGSGLWLEGDSELVKKAKRECGHLPVDVMAAFLTKENIVGLIQDSSRVRDGFDVLVVDIDGNDWWLAQEILGVFSPQLIVTEYNPSNGPMREWVMPYHETHEWDHDNYYGASLVSYAQSMKKFGYVLVGCDSHAVNAFWVKEENADLFGHRSSTQDLFVPALPGSRHRHRGDLLLDQQLSEEQINQINIEFIDVFDDRKSSKKLICAAISNDSSLSISPYGKHPIRIGISQDENLPQHAQRLYLDKSISLKSSGVAWGVFERDFEWSYAAVVQEAVRWGQAITR